MELNFILSVVDRDRADRMNKLFQELDLPLTVTMLGRGTATGELLAALGLVATEKSILTTIADKEKTALLMKNAKRRLFIDIPGHGILMSIPLKSVGGGRTFAYFMNSATESKGAPDMNFDHELILVILNQSYTDDVMIAARDAGAGGGTVIHAKGIGAKYTQKFFEVSLSNEKEIIMIAAKSSKKAEIMKAIVEKAGPHTPAGAIVFSLPISSIAGIRDIGDD